MIGRRRDRVERTRVPTSVGKKNVLLAPEMSENPARKHIRIVQFKGLMKKPIRGPRSEPIPQVPPGERMLKPLSNSAREIIVHDWLRLSIGKAPFFCNLSYKYIRNFAACIRKIFDFVYEEGLQK